MKTRTGFGRQWEVKKARPADSTSVRVLLSSNDLPLEGLDQTEIWCVKGAGGLLLGVAGLEKWGRQGLLRSVAVRSEFMNRGIGTALVNHAISGARRLGVVDLYLLTDSAQRFFGRIGFVRVERSEVGGRVLKSAEFTGACSETAPVMRLVLN